MSDHDDDEMELELELPLGGGSSPGQKEKVRLGPEQAPVERAPRARSGRRVQWQELFIPVHGLVRLNNQEMKIIDHPAFQRLGEIYQLGQTHLVYRGATHKRLEHALGALYVVQSMIEALERNSGPSIPDPEKTVNEWALDQALSDDEILFCRLGALLHDIGHLPAGHTLEDELGLLRPHDADERLRLILDRKEWRGSTVSPTLRELIDQQYGDAAARLAVRALTGGVCTPTEILLLLISKDHAKESPKSESSFRTSVCRDLIGNTICADLLDYLHRDWLHVGKPRYFDTRLLEYMEIRKRETPAGPDSRVVVNLRGGNAVRTDGVTAILDLLESRYQLSEIALFHRTKLCAAAMLERALAELSDAYGDRRQEVLEQLPVQLLDCSDMEMLTLFERLLANAPRGDAAAERRAAGAQQLLERLRFRRLHKQLLSEPEYKLADRATAVQETFIGSELENDRMLRARQGAQNRLAAMRMLEVDFGMSPGSLVMYCPPTRMNTKIADVQVLVHGEVDTLDHFEQTNADRGVTGGHLKAQQARFRRLWRIVIAIDAEERNRLRDADLLQPLGRALGLCILGLSPLIGTIDQAVVSLAREMTTRSSSPLYNRDVVELEAARTASMQFYPTGAPSLLSCCTEKK